VLEVPEDWKAANVSPMFKKKEDLGNYRPISFTSLPGKVLEQTLQEAVSKVV